MYKRLEDILTGAYDNYMLPFYWQQGNHHEQIPAQIEEIYQSGARAFCVESRTHSDYAKDGWWYDMDLILSEAEKRGMKVWILDDDHFPTGHTVGEMKNHPDQKKWNLIERHIDVMGPFTDGAITVDPENSDNILLGAFAYPRTGTGEECTAEAIDLTDKISGSFMHFSLPAGCYRIFLLYKSRRGSSRNDYIDMLSEESVQILVDTVYNKHFEHYGKYFGNTLAGFFSDEPELGNSWFEDHYDMGMYNRRLGMPGLALPWNDRIPSMMEKSLPCENIVSLLPSLWFGMGEITHRARHAYMDAVTKLYRDCFTRTLGDWCEAHGVMYIGHIIEDMNAHARLGCSAGHYFRALDGQHMSGIDIVLHQIMPGMADYIHTASSFGNNADPAFFDYVLAKLASSYAHIGTQMNGRAMCEVFGAYGWAEGGPCMKWLLDYLLVRGVNHFVPHAFSPSFPNGDCPPHFGAGGRDPQFGAFTKLMHYGNKVSHLLSGGIHHADAAILYHADAEWMNYSGEAMLTQVPAKLLYDAHIDFDIIPADCFTDASDSRVFHACAEDGHLRIGNEKYQVLIIPYAKVLPKALEDALSVLEAAGVNIIRMTESAEGLLEAVGESITPDITVSGSHPMLRCCHYTDKSTDIYMFVNESVTNAVSTDVTFNGIGDSAGVILDMLNDDIYSCKAENGAMRLELAPYQSVIAVFDGENHGYSCKKEFTVSYKPELIFDIETADYSDLTHFTKYDSGVSSDRLYNICAAERIPEFSGTIRYTCEFDRSVLPENASVIDLGEVGQYARLWLNGEPVGDRICSPYRFPLDNLVNGKNTLVIEVSNTLANSIRDYFSSFMLIPRSGLIGPVVCLG